MTGHATDLFAFVNSMRASKLMPRTRALYAGAIRRFDEWMRERDSTARKATLVELIEYADTLPFTYASRNAFIKAHKAYWRLHMKRKDEPLADSLFCPRRPDMVYRGLDGPEEARRVIAAAATMDVRAEAACALGYFTALRCAEIAALPRSAVKGENLNVMGKGAKPRTLPIVDELRDVLDRVHRLEGTPWTLPGRPKTVHVATNTVLNWVKLAGERAGLGVVTPHMLRYTAGGQMLDESDDLKGTGMFLGHSRNSLSITAGYTRRKEAKLRRLADTL